MTHTYHSLLVTADLTVKQALKRIGNHSARVLLVCDAHTRLLGIITDGDLRRWILADGLLTECVTALMSTKPITARVSDSRDAIKQQLIKHEITAIPVLNAKKVVVDVVLLTDFIKSATSSPHGGLDVPVIVMAGGRGTRLDPFTKILPKPLIPIGERPLLEIIMDRFHQCGVRTFYLTLNYKSNMIRAYIKDCQLPYKVKFVEESKPLGTGGAIGLIKGKMKQPFFVTNCDIIIHADYVDIYRHHQLHKNKITMVCSLKHFQIPYGIVKIKDGGRLASMEEKPEMDMLVNTGMYVVDPDIVRYIPKGRVFHMTDLIDKIKAMGHKVGIYPVSEDDWVDVGQWEQYQQAIQKMGPA